MKINRLETLDPPQLNLVEFLLRGPQTIKEFYHEKWWPAKGVTLKDY